jgi:hypothetical protein
VNENYIKQILSAEAFFKVFKLLNEQDFLLESEKNISWGKLNEKARCSPR